jgi:hypothetical protein
MLMIFGKNLVKLDIVWLSKNNISLKLWDGGSKKIHYIRTIQAVFFTSVAHMPNTGQLNSLDMTGASTCAMLVIKTTCTGG